MSTPSDGHGEGGAADEQGGVTVVPGTAGPSPAPTTATGAGGSAGHPAPAGPPRAVVATACVGVGALLCLSLPPWGWWPLAFAGIVGIDRLVAGQPFRVRLARAYGVALTMFVPSLWWIGDLTLPGWLVAVVVYAGMLGLGIAVVPPGRGRWLALPGTWVVAELLRWSWPFGGVPLANLAIGQVAGPLAPTARLGGSLLLVLVTVLLGNGLAAALRRERAWAAGLAAAGLAVVLAAALSPSGRAVEEVEVALVQGGGPQGTRASETDERVVFERHLDASGTVETPVDLVVWPEDVVDVEGDVTATVEGRELAELARRLDAPVVAGVVEGDGDRFHNSAVLFEPRPAGGDPADAVTDRYEKVHRVPFGEYVPLRGMLEPIAGDALVPRDARVGEGPAHLDTPIGRVAVAISWEVFFGDRVREGVGQGGELVINPTNGSSFTGTIVQTQQVASSRLRAIETGRWVLQVAPTGFSAVVSPDGDVVQRTAVSERAVLHDTVELRRGLTPYTRWGNAPALLLALAGLVAGGTVHLRRPRIDSR
ncbi:MAG: apolipoprotein N-acyltransferase [Acidimicrobiia bacterium]